MLQIDGNLVIKDGEATIWTADNNQVHSKTLHQKSMGGPVQFIIRNNGFLHDPPRKRLWIAESTHSKDKSLWENTCMIIQDDGNLVIYDKRTGSLRWARFGFVPGRFTKPKQIRVIFEDVPIHTWKFSLPPF